MTNERLNEIEARAAKATRGPWVHLTNEPFWGQIRSCGESPDDPTGFSFVADTPEQDERPDDMEFIAAARADVPDLCVALRDALARVADLENSIANAAIILDAATGDVVSETAATSVGEWREVAREAKRAMWTHFPEPKASVLV